jgi:DNA-binding PadR family transcriptional regulator
VVLESEEKRTAMTNKRTTKPTLPDLVVLSLLSEEAMHGYQLVTELENRDVQDWAAISRPQVYYSLNKLSALKLISTVRDTDSSLGPERTKYAINKRGSEALEESLSNEDWATQRPAPPFQTWLALSAQLPKPALKKVIAKRREFLQEQLEKEEITFANFGGATGAMTVAGRLMVDLCIQMFQLELKWLDEAEPKLLNR